MEGEGKKEISAQDLAAYLSDPTFDPYPEMRVGIITDESEINKLVDWLLSLKPQKGSDK